jgi:hypothetical protein
MPTTISNTQNFQPNFTLGYCTHLLKNDHCAGPPVAAAALVAIMRKKRPVCLTVVSPSYAIVIVTVISKIPVANLTKLFFIIYPRK